ncbi:DUF3141 domain-containing protein [Desulforegula conservatrix]|uniref:DUF3141 domain-containing protein n=1 Tax=Desulforegula conservatrix TaxID=153026 RepID=UPI000401864B|nr:DUF3141 domain-containing protein [Desulforegula conservatrix]
MEPENPFINISGSPGIAGDAYEYCVDTMQRSLIFMDVMRKRGNTYLEHLKQGQPPVLTFDYEMIMDGRELETPVNYSLVKIIDKRSPEHDVIKIKDRRHGVTRRQISAISSKARPIVIIDPRAGHGPGIGGSKRDSEIGIALSEGRPVYFILFYTKPMPGQTLVDVKNAEIKFIEEVVRRHPKSPPPSIIGNCQAGWAAAIVAADRPDIAGPLILNGAPLSYWAGIEGTNPMRYRGGLLGGVWINSFLSDLGNGVFDGANLVSNMEDLNPANTYWSKQYNLYASIDTEEERYLNFEKWWGGFFLLTYEEIHFIVDSLFMGNRLESGSIVMDEKKLDLKNIENPVVVFASKGDNITPPQQALNWIAKVYGSEEEIKRLKKTIIYMIHPHIGHLGIFVAGSVAKKEHKEIIGSIDLIEFLPPGLYEMVIDEKELETSDGRMVGRYEERTIEDILELDDGFEEESDFLPVQYASKFNDNFYRIFISPFVKPFTNDISAEILRQLSPMRFSRYIFADKNPFMFPVRLFAPMARQFRVQADEENMFVMMERWISSMIESSLDLYKDFRDQKHELLFRIIYGNPRVKKALMGKKGAKKVFGATVKDQQKLIDEDRKHWISLMDKGGFEEGFLRIMIAMIGADGVYSRSEFAVSERIIMTHPVLRRIKPVNFRRMLVEQSRILQTDRDMAISSLKNLLPSDSKEREEALKLVSEIILDFEALGHSEKKLAKSIIEVLS